MFVLNYLISRYLHCYECVLYYTFLTSQKKTQIAPFFKKNNLIDDYANYQLEKLDFMEAGFEVSQLLQHLVSG